MEVIADIHPEERKEVARGFDDIKNGRIDNLHKDIRYDALGQYDEYYDLYLAVEKRDVSGAPLRHCRHATEYNRE